MEQQKGASALDSPSDSMEARPLVAGNMDKDQDEIYVKKPREKDREEAQVADDDPHDNDDPRRQRTVCIRPLPREFDNTNQNQEFILSSPRRQWSKPPKSTV